MQQFSYFDIIADPETFYNCWSEAISDEYDNTETYEFKPTANGCSVFLYGGLFFRISCLKSGNKISIPSTLMNLENAPHPVCFVAHADKQSNQPDYLTALLDCSFDFQAFVDWSRIMKPLIFRTLGNESFACCNDYIRCSDAKGCIHPHDIFYNHCTYRENLEAGRIFYGKNANV